MKLRRLSLLNYIAFLGVMFVVWYLTIQAKKHGGYDLSETNDLIEQLQFSLMPTLFFYIQESYTEQQFESFNKTIYKEFKQYNLSIVHHLRESDQQQQQKEQFVIQVFNDQRNEINILNLNQIEIFTTQTNSVHLVKNLKRFLNKYITKDQTQIESQQIYQEKDLVFEFYIVDQLQQKHLPQQIDQTIKNLMNTFDLPEEHYRINYKYIQLEDFELNSLEFRNILKEHSQINSMIWKDYYQLNILLIQGDENNTLTFDQEDYQFVFQEPNNFIHYQRNQEMLMENLFDTFLQLLDLEEQIEIIFDESDYQIDLQILVQHFKLREQLRLYNNFRRELNYMKFLQSEGEYKITTESQKQFELRQEYIKLCLNYNNIMINKNNSVNILIDDRFSDFDTFSFEYTQYIFIILIFRMGTYLPIILPFAYPIILGIYDELTGQ